MEEKIMIQGERTNFKKLFRLAVVIGIILSILLSFFVAQDYINRVERYINHQHTSYCFRPSYSGTGYICYYANFSGALDYAFFRGNPLGDLFVILIPLFICVVLGGFIYLSRRHCELVITNKRICGIPKWNKKVAIPLDSVTATSTRGKHGLTVSTYSKDYTFRSIKNADDVYKALNHLLMEKLAEKHRPLAPIAPTAPVTPPTPPTKEERLAEYENMLKRGIITKREFNKKKKAILGK